MASLSGGQIVVEVMKKEGVKNAFCVPGESYLGVIDALYEHSEIQLISTRHEGGASFMAEAYAKASGEVGVCMATRGPGATNLSIGLHTAMQDSTPLVALIGQVERPFKGKEAFQEVEFSSYFSHLCKWAIEIDSVERIPEMLHRAFYTARSGRPGPVVVSLPHDMLEDTIEYVEGTVVENIVPEVGEDAIEKILGKLYAAKQPVIIAGGGVTQTKSANELIQFADAIKIPVVTSFRRFDAFPNDHVNYAGSLGFGSDKKLLNYIKHADVILSIGNRFSQVTTQDYTLIGEHTEIIQVDIDPNSIGKSYPATIGIVTDAKKFLQKCVQQVKKVKDDNREKILKECHDAYLTFSTLPERSNETNYAEMNAVVSDLMSVVSSDTIITSDAGNFFGWISKYYRFTEEGTYIGPTSGAMGYGLPAAIGAKIACPDKKVISFSGDGGFMMTLQELETAVRCNVPVIAVVINNNMYGTIRMHQEKQFPKRVMATGLTNPNFAELARLFGCHGEQVKESEEFLPALERALKSDKPVVIEVLTNPDVLSAAQAEKNVEIQYT
ncbi:thiamine pyrophosphate-dependent enzyme [Sporosarcina sp. JAI121]|uniref:thiamine pyrophosphate-dependent enzyme n=1 Tax=Sporosarcina sp. JAI121 TaxID=2723064 RepID=UPI0015CC0BA9|nr:thiamine pyrophosphate-dependent enzyme [Sporosarcina sp. JAI121]NYF25243.1 acetolactate synthase-1/2/3 large subunit [Sporosarcina sp. JAI121]